MNKTIKMLGLLAAAAISTPLFCSCEGDQATPPLPLPEEIYNQEGHIGQGTWNCPLTAYQVRLGTKPNQKFENIWACGYIVGFHNTSLSEVMKQNTCFFQTPASAKSNVLISNFTPEELERRFVKRDADGNITEDTRWEHCAPVELEYGAGDARSDLNLSDHPENLGKLVSVLGTTGSKKYGIPAVKFCKYYVYGPQGKDYYFPPVTSGLFALETSVPTGKWCMIVSGTMAAQTFYSASTYMAQTEVTVADDEPLISMENYMPNAFMFEGAPDGKYRIRMSNNIYLCCNGTNKKVFSTSDPNEPNAQFTVTMRPDGTVSIKSAANAYLAYDTEYTSFGLYTSITAKQLYPNIYGLSGN